MRRHSIWNYVLSLIISIIFLYYGLTPLLTGYYVFAFAWYLISGTFFIQSLRNLIRAIKARRYDFDEIDDEKEDVDIYGHRTPASYEKQRLQKLADLYHSGMITKDEYEEKRKQIIDGL